MSKLSLGAAGFAALVVLSKFSLSEKPSSPSSRSDHNPLTQLKAPSTDINKQKLQEFLGSVLNNRLSPSDEIAKQLFDYYDKGLVHKSIIESLKAISSDTSDPKLLEVIVANHLFEVQSLDAWLTESGFSLEQRQTLARGEDAAYLKAAKCLVNPNQIMDFIWNQERKDNPDLPKPKEISTIRSLLDIEGAIQGFQSLDPDGKLGFDSVFWAPLKAQLDGNFNEIVAGYDKLNESFSEERDKIEIPLPRDFADHKEYFGYLDALQNKLFPIKEIKGYTDDAYISPDLSKQLMDRIISSQNQNLGYDVNREISRVIRAEPDIETSTGLQDLKTNLDTALRSFLDNQN